jgi:tRNA (adenine37-N6)-methyltransferase
VEVLFRFDRVDPVGVHTRARRPRGNPAWPEVGIFAQRAKDRPNRLGTSICRLVAVRGLDVDVEGLDAVDGTPVLDLKPCMRGFLPRGEVAEPAWASDLMRGYW